MTRRLVDVAQNCIITEYDCGTIDGIEIKTIIEGGEVVMSLAEQILGRTVTADIYHPVTNKLIISAGDLIDEEKLEKIEASGLDFLKVRSVLTCKTDLGICAKCYVL